jgi:type I restriction enzyme, S subunit
VEFSSGGTPSKDEPIYWNGSIPWISASSMYDTNLAKSELNVTELAIGNGTRLAKKGSILVLVRGSMLFNRVPMGIAAIDVAFNQDVKALAVSNDGISGEFLLYQMLAVSPRIPINETGIGAGKIDTETLANLNIFLPSPAEQQKIADCLSSLDELIAAEGRKLESLRAYKKGLMQQLFPRDGETTPRLRFPEFRNAPEWGRRKLGGLCGFVRGPFGGALKKEIFVREGFAVYEQSHAIDNQVRNFRYFITEDKYDEMRRFAVQPNDIIMSCSGTMGKFARLPRNPVPGVINQALLKLTVQEGSNAEFILLVLGLPATQSKLLTQSAGGAIKNVVGVPQLKDIEVPIPGADEQQRVADFHSSLETAIAAQAQKLDGLRTHRKGLMQQLFPSAEAEA